MQKSELAECEFHAEQLLGAIGQLLSGGIPDDEREEAAEFANTACGAIAGFEDTFTAEVVDDHKK